MKSKKISKTQGKSDYINFFKHYFPRLAKEHPKWHSKQITCVIKLLWKKKKASTISSRKITKLAKPMSGRMFFIRMFKKSGMVSQEAMKRWKRLPHESRMIYKSRGDPSSMSRRSPKESVSVMKLSPESKPNSLNFLSKMI